MSKVCRFMQARSPFVWLKWRDPVTTKQIYENTKIKPSDPMAEKKLRRRIHKIEGRMLDDSDNKTVTSEAWHLWVGSFIQTRWQAKPKTLKRYMTRWKWINDYIVYAYIPTPRDFLRENVYNYVEWRTKQVKEKSKKTVSINTALAELKLLKMILKEAINRGFCETDVTEKHGIQPEDPPEKPEMTDEEIDIIKNGLDKKARENKKMEWMQIALNISLKTGCRHADTRIDRRNVNFENSEIKFTNPKGGSKKAFVHIASDDALSYLKKLFSDGRQSTWDLPKKEMQMTSLYWSKFFKKEIKLTHLCFHCTRVTYISRGERAGVPEPVMRKQVNHADAIIHEIYKRRNFVDMKAYANAVKL